MSFRSTGATAKSVFNWENRFSMIGCRLCARSTSSAVSCRSVVSRGKIPSSRSALAKAMASSNRHDPKRFLDAGLRRFGRESPQPCFAIRIDLAKMGKSDFGFAAIPEAAAASPLG